MPCGYVYVDGSSVGEITDAELKDRRILGEEGFISIFAVVDSTTGKVLAGPHIQARGFAEDHAVFADILPEITAALEEAPHAGGVDTHSCSRSSGGSSGAGSTPGSSAGR